MYSFLPDELLKEILAPALQIPDDSFASTEGRSPFSNNTKTTSAYLLVCKDWLRVTTPLLYSVVVLRSRAQIQALEFALESTPDLAGFIKKLRIESGYCSSLLKIIKGVKNLTDLCLSLEVYSSDNVSAICKGFALIQPRRLIIYDLDRHSNKAWNQKAQQLIRTIYEYIGTWELTTVVLPAWDTYFFDENAKIEEFVDALCTSESLEVVSVASQYNCPDWLDRLSKIPTLKRILIRGSHTIDTPFNRYLRGNARLSKLVRFASDHLQPSTPPNGIKELQGSLSPKLPVFTRDWLIVFPDAVWTNIISYAMGIPELEEHDFSQTPRPFNYSYGPKFRRGLVRVCKKFKELAIPLYYQCIVITYDRDLESLSALLSRSEELGKQIKSFFTVDQSHGTLATQNLNKALPYMSNLQRISTNFTQWNTNMSSDIFDWQAFTTLSQKAGGRLVDLAIHLHRPTQPKTPGVIYGFTALKHLDFSSSAKFTFDPATAEQRALPNLESVTCTSINNTFLSLLSCIDLPKIQNARFPVLDKCEGAITFLRKHGRKLRSLEVGFLPGVSVFDICPNLRTFQVPREKPGFAVAEFFSSTDVHPLELLDIKTEDVAKGAEKEKFKYIGGLDLSNFTSLSRIKVVSCEWPTTENGIRKSHWVMWAERLKEKYGVDIVDEHGQNWIPRLRARRER